MKRIRILVVEDQNVVRDGLIAILSYQTDMEVVAEAADGIQAVEMARKEKRACVIVAETEKQHFPPWSGIWWDVAPAEATADLATLRLRQQYEAERQKLQRLYY